MNPYLFLTLDSGFCPADLGSGSIAQTTNLPSGSTFTYLVHGDVSSVPEALLSMTVAVTLPGGVNDISASDNSATDTDPVGVFIDRFE